VNQGPPPGELISRALAGALTSPLSQSLPSIRDKTHTKATRKDVVEKPFTRSLTIIRAQRLATISKA